MTCPCQYPLIITTIDEDGDSNEFMAMPNDEEYRRPQEIKNTEYKGVKYVAVKWRNVGTHWKEYEVNDHIVLAGCSNKGLKKKHGKMVCDEKEIFVVFHPEQEWVDYHVKEIRT